MVLMICPVTNADLHSGVIAFERSGHLMFSIMEWMMTLNQWVFLICNFLIHPTFILLDSAAVGQKLMASEATQDGRRSEVAWHRFRVPTTQDRKRLGSWIVELQSRTMVVDRLAVDVSGEKYIGAKVDGSERVVARRFAYTWAIDHQEDRERIVFADQSLLGAPREKKGKAYLVDSQASSYDQLRIKNWFHGATGKLRHLPSKSKSLNTRFRLCGVFDPICATTGGVVSIATGNAFERHKCQLHEKNLIGIYKQQNLTVAAFEYQPVPQLIFVRVASFRDAVPVQVDDFLSMGTDLAQVLELGDHRGRKELSLLRKIVKPYARTTSVWTSNTSVQLPVKLLSLTLGGEQDFEVKAQFQWRIGSQVPDAAFDVGNLGSTSPFAMWAEAQDLR